MSARRVLLIEDDPLLQRFVEMALEEMDLTLQSCASVGEAIAALRQAPADLIITDLLLPDASGSDLLARLQAEPALRGNAPVVVFSAGLDQAARRTELLALGAWRLLAKPCSLDELEDCVTEGLAGAGTNGRMAAGAGPAQASPVQSHFGGDAALYQAFRTSCLQQFARDIETGDAACRDADAQALRRLAHSLKSVLQTLGHAAESRQAASLELAAEAADWPQALPLWQSLSRDLIALR